MATASVSTSQDYVRKNRKFSGWLNRIEPVQRKVQTKITKQRQTDKSRTTTSRLKKWKKKTGTSGKWLESKMGVLRCVSEESHSIHLNNFMWNINLHFFLYYYSQKRTNQLNFSKYNYLACVKPSNSLEIT